MRECIEGLKDYESMREKEIFDLSDHCYLNGTFRFRGLIIRKGRIVEMMREEEIIRQTGA